MDTGAWWTTVHETTKSRTQMNETGDIQDKWEYRQTLQTLK